jgi:hypothetical protein
VDGAAGPTAVAGGTLSFVLRKAHLALGHGELTKEEGSQERHRLFALLAVPEGTGLASMPLTASVVKRSREMYEHGAAKNYCDKSML